MSTPIQFVQGVGPYKAALLAKIGIFTVSQLLRHYPRRYEDRSQPKNIAALADGEVESFRAVVHSFYEVKPRRGLTITKVCVTDATGMAELVWFNQTYVKKNYYPGMEVIVSGKVDRRFRQIQVTAPEVELISDGDTLHSGRIIPIYCSSENISQRFLRNLIYDVIHSSIQCQESLPRDILKNYNLLDRPSAVSMIHFPSSWGELNRARHRLVFEELYYLQYGLLVMKQKNKYRSQGIKHLADGPLIHRAMNCLPFTLTNDQQTALSEIKADMQDVAPMQRLLQGDVGSGKTVIAALALVKTVESGYQGAMMAPTEILAEQHYHTLSTMLEPLKITIALLTGRVAKRVRADILRKLQEGRIDIIIGTHALIQDDVVFRDLGLVVTDEQHRFGVNQRAQLQAKGGMPDVLVMTATPIPRTMALTVYGDLDVSSIREMPPGRKVVKTFFRGNEMRDRVYQFVLNEVEAGRQAYIVCPLIEESEKVQVQSATKLYEQLRQTYFSTISVGLVHGKLRAKDKDEVMQAFYQGKIKVLVATTVIEVGVNVPNSTVMVVEGADRFGLAQLHQLRGRIGRGEYQSYCILLSDNKTKDTRDRLMIMTQTTDGFEVAEKDLEMRGPGQFFGMRQHGLPDLKIANIVSDTGILLEARQAAFESVNNAEYLTTLLPTLVESFGEEFRLVFCS